MEASKREIYELAVKLLLFASNCLWLSKHFFSFWGERGGNRGECGGGSAFVYSKSCLIVVVWPLKRDVFKMDHMQNRREGASWIDLMVVSQH